LVAKTALLFANQARATIERIVSDADNASEAVRNNKPPPMTGVLFPQGGSPPTHQRPAPFARPYTITRWFGLKSPKGDPMLVLELAHENMTSRAIRTTAA
jgi:hypothetical protein